MNKVNLTGRRFGRLVVISENGKMYSARVIGWLCRCDCGNTKTISASSLRRGRTLSCGCLNKDIASRRALGMLKTISNNCRQCGKLFISEYVYNAAQTCSPECKRLYDLELIHNRYQKDFNHALSRVTSSVLARSKERGFECNINLSKVKELYRKQKGICAKTGVYFELSKGRGISGRSPNSLSIDRIDPKKGYIEGNVQLVTIMYNLCKGTWSDVEVRKFAEAVIKYNKGLIL